MIFRKRDIFFLACIVVSFLAGAFALNYYKQKEDAQGKALVEKAARNEGGADIADIIDSHMEKWSGMLDEIEKNANSSKVVDHQVSYEQIYKDFKNDKSQADRRYYGNRYILRGTLDYVASLDDGEAGVILQIQIENEVVELMAFFESEDAALLRYVNVGDMVSIDGECIDADTWKNCKLRVSEIER